MGLEIPPLKCQGIDYGDGDVDVTVSAGPAGDGGVGIGITITIPDSPVTVNIVPFPPFVIPGINWDFFFGPTHIETQKQEIQGFFRPIFRFLSDNYGIAVRDYNFLDFHSPGVRQQFRNCPQLAAMAPSFLEDAHWVLKCMKQKESDTGFGQRVVNQFLANACINQWSVQQTEDVWDAVIQAIIPNPQCLPQCVTATQLLRYILAGHDVPQDAKDFLSEKDNWDTNVLYCFPKTFIPVGCPPPGPQPSPTPVPQPEACPPGMVRLPNGTCFCPLPAPTPQPKPLPQPRPQPTPQPTPQPQPQTCPPACQSQIDNLWRCCENAIGQVNAIWNSIHLIWESIDQRVNLLWQNIYTIWEFLNSIDTRIETHIENWWDTTIKVYVDEMCERCKALPLPAPPPDTQQETDCEEGIRKWGLWAECWLAAHTEEPADVGDGIAWCDSMTTLKATCAEAAAQPAAGRWADALTLARQAVANGLQEQFGVDVLPGVDALPSPTYIFEATP